MRWSFFVVGAPNSSIIRLSIFLSYLIVVMANEGCWSMAFTLECISYSSWQWQIAALSSLWQPSIVDLFASCLGCLVSRVCCWWWHGGCRGGGRACQISVSNGQNNCYRHIRERWRAERVIDDNIISVVGKSGIWIAANKPSLFASQPSTSSNIIGYITDYVIYLPTSKEHNNNSSFLLAHSKCKRSREQVNIHLAVSTALLPHSSCPVLYTEKELSFWMRSPFYFVILKYFLCKHKTLSSDSE